MKFKIIFLLTCFMFIFMPAISIFSQGLESGGFDPYAESPAKNLSEASYKNKLADAESLIKNGAPVNAYDKWGWTPLMWACYFKNYDIVRLLLEKGADPNLKSKDGYQSIPVGSTPLMMAACNGHAMIVKLLLKHKADKNIVNGYGLTAASYARNAASEETCNILKD